MSSLNLAAIALAVSSSLLGTFFLSLYRRKGDQALRFWSASWFVLAVHLAVSSLVGNTNTSARISATEEWFLAAAALTFYWSARLYARRPVTQLAMIAAAAGAAIWSAAYSYGRFPIPLSAGAALLFFLTAETFWAEGRKRKSNAEVWLATTFFVWGVLEASTAIVARSATARERDFSLASSVPMFFAGIFMVMAVYEAERRRVERSMLESSNLVQQTSRRSDELHILNEIGRALNSTLELDLLLERIYSEMRRLVAVSSFFIASYDPTKEEIRFEIEVEDDNRLPKRSRPAGNHLVEYVIRTRQPLLIRERYREETQRLGIQPLRQVGSMCAAPLIRYDRAVGVVMVHSPRERVFDETHLELLRVLANEAGIAIENARLFTEEQKKARHLTLINNVSNHAITTLNPAEMLEKIALEIEGSLAYDHIGIATLDYVTKDLIVQAEAGARREARGRRIGLGEGMVGQVGRSGQMAMVREADASTPKTVLPDSVSSIALPVIYAEQLLGVLYVESSKVCDFPEQEVLLLRTLADLFAGALHNALTFQKAQEQAITDGLTGVKTHRFLMEALSSEWKRSTRANRPFALVLMDLDRFKFVNDFYGHLEGDVILRRVGHILEQNCRRSDVVARYGGDEFVILMPETSVDQARQLANKLRTWVASDPLLGDKNVTASFGIAGFPVHGSTPQELIQVADSSMYLSKHQGGNSVSSAEQGDPNDRKRWKKDVLEAYLGVTLKRLFSTGPEAFEEIYRRLELFTRSLVDQDVGASEQVLPPAVVETVTSLAFAIDAKDQYTQGHSQKVSAYAVMLAQALALDQAEVEEIRLAALLHDIGKVGIPESILNKSGPLDASEWETMKTHTELGAKILEPLETMARIRQMVRHHHEFYDGSGYPDRLQGEAIPYGSRVIAIADSYDTITSERSYKKGRSPEEAFAELERCAASQFDPAIVRVFVEKMRRFPDPKSRFKEFSVQSGR